MKRDYGNEINALKKKIEKLIASSLREVADEIERKPYSDSGFVALKFLTALAEDYRNISADDEGIHGLYNLQKLKSLHSKLENFWHLVEEVYPDFLKASTNLFDRLKARGRGVSLNLDFPRYAVGKVNKPGWRFFLTPENFALFVLSLPDDYVERILRDLQDPADWVIEPPPSP